MARIRSIHPGLFTDEAYMSCSMAARQLMLGLWCEAWDDGVFEWKPITLKARVFPVDAVDVTDLLAELVENLIVTQFEVEGKFYGAIRNFRKFQRPKKPNCSEVLPNHLRSYVGLSDAEFGTETDLTSASPPPVPHQFRTSSEIPPQMEDGGGNKKTKPNGFAKKDDLLESENPPESAPTEKPKRTKPRSRVPPDWWPSDTDIQFAIDRGMSREDVSDEVTNFRNYHAGKGSLQADWSATWRTWAGNHKKFKKSSGGSAAKQQYTDNAEAFKASRLRAAAEYAQPSPRDDPLPHWGRLVTPSDYR